MSITKNLGPVTAYGIAVAHGFVGTEEEWLKSLQGGISVATKDTAGIVKPDDVTIKVAADGTLSAEAQSKAWTGTQAEWDALTDDEKTEIGEGTQINITDDATSAGEVKGTIADCEVSTNASDVAGASVIDELHKIAVINVTYDSTDEDWYIDKTFDEITELYNKGYYCVAVEHDTGYYDIAAPLYYIDEEYIGFGWNGSSYTEVIWLDTSNVLNWNWYTIPTVDSTLSSTSTNSIQNKAVYEALSNKEDKHTVLMETLAVSDEPTDITFTNSAITDDAIIDIYTSVYGVNPTAVDQSGTTLTLTFGEQTEEVTVKVVIS